MHASAALLPALAGSAELPARVFEVSSTQVRSEPDSTRARRLGGEGDEAKASRSRWKALAAGVAGTAGRRPRQKSRSGQEIGAAGDTIAATYASAAAVDAAAEAYVTMLYGPTSNPAISGLFVLLDSIRQQDRQREVVILRVHDDERSEALEYACQRFAPCRTHAVPRLVLRPAVHPECARHLRAWASPNASVVEGEVRGSMRKAWWAKHGVRLVPLKLRSIFTVFNTWSLTEYRRIVWLESDQLVLSSLADLWSIPLDNGRWHAAAVPTGAAQGLPCRGHRAAKYNTGVVVMRPNATVYRQLVNLLSTGSFFDSNGVRRRFPAQCNDGFQTMWNRVLAPYVRCLPRAYNCLSEAGSPSCLTHKPAVLHFAGSAAKPWQVVLPSANGSYRRREDAFSSELHKRLSRTPAYRRWSRSAMRLARYFEPFLNTSRGISESSAEPCLRAFPSFPPHSNFGAALKHCSRRTI